MNDSDFVKLPRGFYVGPDVVKIARDLLDKYLICRVEGETLIGRIVETEAYNGREDKACHAFGKRTNRTEVMYEEGGKAYIYLCYGIHHLFNIVTNVYGLADAVLIRAVEPVEGIISMQERRNTINTRNLTSGPGKLSQAFGILSTESGEDLVTSDRMWIAKKKKEDRIDIETDVRVGVDYAEEDALLPWRFYIKDNPFVSVKKNPSRL